MVNGWLLLLLLAIPGEILVLKNGKKVPCDSFERKGKNVHVYRKGETFALPEQMIDWAKSKAAANAQAEKEKAQAEKLAAKRAAAQAKKDKKNLGAYYEGKTKKTSVSITDQSIEDKGFSTITKPVVVGYQTQGNTILVAVTINGQGPFDFILDTGAAMTLVSPQTANTLGLSPTGAVSVHGVGGGGTAQTAQVLSIALGQARVNNMPVVIQAIPVLAHTPIVGLLGQDFLNHFVMNLDSARQTVTLNPHAGQFTPKSDMEIAAAFQGMVPEMEKLVTRVGALTEAYLAGNIRPGGQKALGEFKAQLPGMSGQLREYRMMLDKRDTSNLPKGEHQRIKTVARCMHWYEQALDKMSRHITLMRRVFHAQDSSYTSEVRDSWERVANDAKQYETCMNGQ